MGLMDTTIKWHDLRQDPTDLPDEGENIIVTEECLNGDRRVRLDVVLKYDEDDRHWFYGKYYDKDLKSVQECVVWNPIIAWAYPPGPFDYF